MTQPTRDWLPDGALIEPELLDRLDSAVAEWSAKWFGDRSFQRIGRASISRSASGERAWRHLASGVWIDLPASTGLALARHALALGGAQPKASTADERLLAHYAERIASELAAQVASALRARGDVPAKMDDLAPTEAGLELKLRAATEGPALHVFLEASALVTLRKRLCRPWRGNEAETQPLSRALAGSSVSFEASLGIARMSALDLQNIAPGDVVVLERATSDPVLLRAHESGTTIAGARLVREDGKLQLKAC